MTNAEHDKDMIESIEMWLRECELKYVEKELAWLEELRTRLLEEKPVDWAIEKIRTEIQRISSRAMNEEGQDLCVYLLSSLSDLEKSLPAKVVDGEGLEEEINRYLEPIHTQDIQFEPFTQMTKCARHFAQWGAEHLKK